MKEPLKYKKREDEEPRSNATEDVSIDPDNLDRECVRLPSLYLQYAQLAAEAKRDVNELSNLLEVTEAEVSAKIRAHPENYKIEKVTEAAIKAAIITHPEIRRAEQVLLKAKHKLDIHQAAVSALEHKKRSLTLLVELHGMSYYSNPKISERGRDAVHDITKKKIRNAAAKRKEDWNNEED